MAGKDTVRLYATLDASGVKKGASQAEAHVAGLGKGVDKHFGRVRDVALGAGLALGAQGVLGILHDSVAAFGESEAAAARMNAQLATINDTSRSTKKYIDEAIQSQSKFGAFDDEDLQNSFTNILRVTGDVRKSLDLNNLVMDIARARNISLADASNIVAKAAAGQTKGLKSIGVELDKGASSTEALRAAQEKFSGQAEAFGNTQGAAAQRASVAWENFQEELGGKVAPALADAANAGTGLIGVVSDLTGAVGGLGPILAGAAGFGAVKILGPELQGFAGAFSKARVAGTGAGGIFKAAGAGLTSMVNPITLIAAGAGAAAIGLVAMANASSDIGEEANDAANALANLADAQLGVEGAQNAVRRSDMNLADSKRALRSATQASANASVHLTNVIKNQPGDQAALNAATNAYVNTLHNVKSRQLDVADAATQVKEAQGRLLAQQTILKDSAQNLSKEFGGLSSKALQGVNRDILIAAGGFKAAGKGVKVTADDVESAGQRWADAFKKAVANSDTLSASSKTLAGKVADLVTQYRDIPLEKRTKIVADALAAGKTLDDIKATLDAIHDKTVTLTVRSVIVGGGGGTAPVGRGSKDAIIGPGTGRLGPGPVQRDVPADAFLKASTKDALALAESTLDEGDDRTAAGLAVKDLERALNRPDIDAKTRRNILIALGGFRRQAQAPAVDISPGDTGGSSGDAGAGGDASGDQAAQIGQLTTRLDTALRQAGYATAELGAFRGSGDLQGNGGITVHYNLAFPPTPDQAMQVAAATATGFNLQAPVASPRTALL